MKNIQVNNIILKNEDKFFEYIVDNYCRYGNSMEKMITDSKRQPKTHITTMEFKEYFKTYNLYDEFIKVLGKMKDLLKFNTTDAENLFKKFIESPPAVYDVSGGDYSEIFSDYFYLNVFGDDSHTNYIIGIITDTMKDIQKTLKEYEERKILANKTIDTLMEITKNIDVKKTMKNAKKYEEKLKAEKIKLLKKQLDELQQNETKK